MKLSIAAIGKLKAGPERELYQHYAGRLTSAGKVMNIGPLALLEVAESRKRSVEERRAEEAEKLLSKVPAGATFIALDEKGDALTSAGIARLLQDARDGGMSALAFILGGPDGLAEGVRQKAAKTVSLGAITLPHGLARVLLAEQLYRAVTILTGHPYHRG